MIVYNRTSRTVFSSWWWTVDRGIFISLLMLTLIGGTMVMASSPQVARRIELPEDHFIIRHIIFLALSVVTFFSISFMNAVQVRRLAAIGFAVGVILMVMLPFSSLEIKGAKRWLMMGGLSIQPSEFVKPFFAVLAAWLFARKYMHPGFPGFGISTAMYALVVFLLIIQPDLGMTIIISLVWITQFFIAGLPLIWIIIAAIGSVCGLFMAYHFLPHVTKRIDLFLGSDTSANYQVDKSLEAFSSGGIFGVGIGEGKVKAHIPDSHTDFVFAVLGEEFGVVACIIVAGLFAFIVIKSFIKARREDDLFTILAITGLATQFGAQAMVNIGVSLHLLPTKGMTLPFLSYGGSSTLALAIGMGMLLALTRKKFI